MDDLVSAVETSIRSAPTSSVEQAVFGVGAEWIDKLVLAANEVRNTEIISTTLL